ncbi:MAG: type II toxin-antitoxin system VapC family toxin [Acidobacteria bacterium]|nr:MAG: type II toxin-antitoxin system VapC family toxin [Acidobacteriota bacterium]
MIVLDTHVWVWWVSGSTTLPGAVQDEIEASTGSGTLHVSSISAWEVALLVKQGRLDLTMDVVDCIAKSEAFPFLRFVPVDNNIAYRSTNLPGTLHKDPADRLIIATTLILGAKLITRDKNIRNYPHVETLWQSTSSDN